LIDVYFLFRAPASGSTEDGASWSWTTDGIFTLQHSIFGFIKVVRNSAPLYYNIYVTQTQGCESLGVKGLCNIELIQISEQQFVFDDISTPPPPPTVPPPDNYPCDNLPINVRAAFLQEATAACSRVVDQSTLIIPCLHKCRLCCIFCCYILLLQIQTMILIDL
jgi:hypothetical protein